ncbi:hypothetical protein [Vibrio scophthalmi]|uniref:SMODS and SLOG-associating 2TM effector domain-containing protein n=1 Tax=Vibrio scophthalmi TaxID=45658 RepID=A0A1E3WMC8_9VIBR|nr:hypothetical protein [Vibrio scophthalmi]ODS10931.1 hypothetical protein VSF3289_01192 [Vibrio scophthalmi]
MSEINQQARDRHWNIMWNVRLGTRYHMHLQNFYSRIGKFITVISLVSSSAAFASVYQQDMTLTKALACVVALAQILDLVIDTKGKSLLHASLKQKYLHLESELSGVTYLTEEQEKMFAQKRISIELEEPPLFDSLLDKCHNELVKAYGLDSEQLEQLSRWTKTKAWWFS